MDKNLKHISKAIREGNLLEVNIPQLFNQLADQYNVYSGVRLAMHYFAFYETYCDDENTWSKEALEITAKLNKIIQSNILGNQIGTGREEAIKAIDFIRKDITQRMEALTAYTDIFQTYEYILNRQEYRFKEEFSVIDDEEFTKEILRYIFDTEDNVIINEKIKEMIGQLPVRITKQKYFELLKGSIHAYLGADVSSLDSYLYMLKTSAMLYQTATMESLYPNLWEKKERLSQVDYKNMTKEVFDQALTTLQAAALTIEIESIVYYSLQEIVNEVYSQLLCSPYAGMVPNDTEKAEKAVHAILVEINNYFINNEKHEVSEEQLEMFRDIEGVQEELAYDISILEDTLYEVNTNHRKLTESLMLEHLLQVLLYTKNLLSYSLFIDLEEDELSETVVDEARIEKEMQVLEEELLTLFKDHDRLISRAVMANTINKIPVFFISHKEVMDYVLYSLERCTDLYEKEACYEIINQIMSD